MSRDDLDLDRAVALLLAHGAARDAPEAERLAREILGLPPAGAEVSLEFAGKVLDTPPRYPASHALKSLGTLDLETAAGGDLLIVGGSALKSLGNDRVGGWLVHFGTPDRSRHRDMFTPDTHFGRHIPGEVDVFVDHGLDEYDDEQIGTGAVTVEAKGLAIVATLDRSTRGGADVLKTLARDPEALGWSSGSAGHLVRREKRADGTHQVKRWPIVEASIAPRTRVADPNAQAWPARRAGRPRGFAAGGAAGAGHERKCRAALATIARLERHFARRDADRRATLEHAARHTLPALEAKLARLGPRS